MTWCMHIASWIPKATNTHTQAVQFSLLFHSNNGCTNAPLCYVYCLSCFSAYGVSLGPLGAGNRATRFFDFGWIDCFGGQGLYWVLFNSGTFRLFVMWVIILLFVLIYYINMNFRARRRRYR
jgi:hypothetical protein